MHETQLEVRLLTIFNSFLREVVDGVVASSRSVMTAMLAIELSQCLRVARVSNTICTTNKGLERYVGDELTESTL